MKFFNFIQALLVFFLVLIPSSYLAPILNSESAGRQSALLQILLVLALPLVISKLLKLNIATTFKLHLTSRQNLVITVILALGMILLLNEIDYLLINCFKVYEDHHKQLSLLLKAKTSYELSYFLILFAVIPAVCEEFLFRGFILNRLLNKDNQWQAILLSSILFGFFHRSLYYLLPTTLAGVFLAVIVIRTGSLFTAIGVHFLVNAWAILASNYNVIAIISGQGIKINYIHYLLIIISFVAVCWLSKLLTPQPDKSNK